MLHLGRSDCTQYTAEAVEDCVARQSYAPALSIIIEEDDIDEYHTSPAASANTSAKTYSCKAQQDVREVDTSQIPSQSTTDPGQVK